MCGVACYGSDIRSIMIGCGCPGLRLQSPWLGVCFGRGVAVIQTCFQIFVQVQFIVVVDPPFKEQFEGRWFVDDVCQALTDSGMELSVEFVHKGYCIPFESVNIGLEFGTVIVDGT